MPIDVTVYLPEADLLRPLLALWPDAILRSSSLDSGCSVGRLAGVAIAESYYGLVSSVTDDVEELLAGHEDAAVIWFDDLVLTVGSVPAWEGLFGTWRPGFLRYLKAIAAKARVEIVVHYEHERGDFPYEAAQWTFDYGNPRASFESLVVRKYDGGSELWSASACLGADGRLHTDYQRAG